MERAGVRRAYFWLMGTCIGLIVLAWYVVRLWSTPLAVGMSIVAAVIPPIAAVVGNWGDCASPSRRLSTRTRIVRPRA